jgi:hypothetical protein
MAPASSHLSRKSSRTFCASNAVYASVRPNGASGFKRTKIHRIDHSGLSGRVPPVRATVERVRVQDRTAAAGRSARATRGEPRDEQHTAPSSFGVARIRFECEERERSGAEEMQANRSAR